MVSFDLPTINIYYDLQDIEDDEYNKLLEIDTVWDHVLCGLCRRGMKWKRTLKGAIQSFLSKEMDRYVKI